MSLRYMLDTNICIAVLRQAPPALLGRFSRHAAQICISTVTLAELHYGAENSKRRAENLDGIEQLTARLAVLDFDRAAAAEYGRVRVALKRKPIGALDMMIAAHAICRGLMVVTNNRAEFSRVPGLQAEDWLP